MTVPSRQWGVLQQATGRYCCVGRTIAIRWALRGGGCFAIDGTNMKRPADMAPSSMVAASKSMWRSNTSSAVTLVLTLAMIKHFSKPQSASASSEGETGGRARPGSKPRVDMVSPSVGFMQVDHFDTP